MTANFQHRDSTPHLDAFLQTPRNIIITCWQRSVHVIDNILAILLIKSHMSDLPGAYAHLTANRTW